MVASMYTPSETSASTGFFDDASIISLTPEAYRPSAVLVELLVERNQLRTSLEECIRELQETRHELRIQSNHANALLRKIFLLEEQLRQHKTTVRHSQAIIQRLATAEYRDQTSHGQNSSPSQASSSELYQIQPNEREILLQQIERQKWEIQKWKEEAHGRGNEAVSRCWQASVDEAVRREREKDEWFIKHLLEKVKTLETEAGEQRKATRRVPESENILTKSICAGEILSGCKDLMERCPKLLE